MRVFVKNEQNEQENYNKTISASCKTSLCYTIPSPSRIKPCVRV
jgi:hypothetical protein